MVVRCWVGASLVASLALLSCSSAAESNDVSGGFQGFAAGGMQTANGGSWSIFASGSGGVDAVAAGSGNARQAGNASDWYDDSFERRRLVTADPGLGAGEALCDFPAPIALPADTFTPGSVRADGGDLRFADTSGQTLSHQLQVWDASGQSLVWLRFPKLPVPAAIYMYYDAPDKALDAGATGAWEPPQAAETDERSPTWIAARAQVAAGTAVVVGPEQRR